MAQFECGARADAWFCFVLLENASPQLLKLECGVHLFSPIGAGASYRGLPRGAPPPRGEAVTPDAPGSRSEPG